MKKLYKITSYFCVIVLITFLFGSLFTIKSFAAVSDSQKAYGHQGSWGSYPYNYSLHYKYWIIQDAIGVPTATVLNPQYFYTYDNITFCAYDGADVFTLILNRGLGIITKPAELSGLLSAFFASITQPDADSNLFIQGAVYDGNDNFLGYALNDITGCYYDGLHQGEAVTIPDESVENVYNFYKYYTGNNPDYPEYFTYYPSTLDTIKNHYYDSTNIEAISSNLDTILSTYDDVLGISYIYQPDYSSFITKFENNWTDSVQPLSDFYITTNGYGWTNFCTNYQLINGNTELLYTDLASIRPGIGSNSGADYNLGLVYNRTDGSSLSAIYTNIVDLITNTNRGIDSGANGDFGWINVNSSYCRLRTLFGQPYTIYRSTTAYNNIVINNTYNQNTYVTDSYKNYDSNNDNSITVAPTQITSSTTNNSTIYQEASDNFYNNVDNGVVNTENITNYVTNITNNYYPSNGGGDNPDNPDLPDDPNNPDVPDSPILDRLLEALLNFFEAIGKIIGTVLTGIIDMFSSVLEAIASLMGNITNLSDFFASILGWLPSPIPEVLGVGISICILAAVIKFIRG